MAGQGWDSLLEGEDGFDHLGEAVAAGPAALEAFLGAGGFAETGQGYERSE